MRRLVLTGYGAPRPSRGNEPNQRRMLAFHRSLATSREEAKGVGRAILLMPRFNHSHSRDGYSVVLDAIVWLKHGEIRGIVSLPDGRRRAPGLYEATLAAWVNWRSGIATTA